MAVLSFLWLLLSFPLSSFPGDMGNDARTLLLSASFLVLLLAGDADAEGARSPRAS